MFFDQLQLPSPAFHLGVGSGSHGQQTGEMLKGVEAVLEHERPGVVLVYGDTNSTLAGALAASKMRIPVAHVESGLRSYNRSMPEEINRVLVDHVSSVLCSPSHQAVENLKKEGITTNVFEVGDVMRDVILQVLSEGRLASACRNYGLEPGQYAIATIHRAENTNSRLKLAEMLSGLKAVASECLPVLMPVHPRTQKLINEWQISTGNLQLVEPVSYYEMVVLQRDAHVVLTDSGGMQKEALWLGVPCLTLRDETEWVETVETGWNRLTGSNRQTIVEGVRTAAPPGPSPPDLYGDGTAGQMIVEILSSQFGASVE